MTPSRATQLRAGFGTVWARFASSPYSVLLVTCTFTILLYIFIVPRHYYHSAGNRRALAIAFLCGALVGVSEISTRYRDEQIKAVLSPDGLAYIICNGALSTFALILIFHFQNSVNAFSVFKNNLLTAAIAAGFGATAVMRTRIAVIKTPDNKDVSIGPDIVIHQLLSLVDRRIDRWRSAIRQKIIVEHFGELIALGPPVQASEYLLASLLSFQNLDTEEKKNLSSTIKDNMKPSYSTNLQLAALGFLFLTVVGEENFASVLEKAKAIQGPPPPPVPPSSPSVSPPRTP
jgi:hypothetical protein